MSTDSSRKYYVYAHIDPADNVFYIGKGSGNRAWAASKARDGFWQRYVDYFDGQYRVEILKENLTEGEAFDFENNYMEVYMYSVVNWENHHLPIDYAVLKKRDELIKKTELLMLEARKCESDEVEKAIQLYREAMQLMFLHKKKYRDISPRKGLVAKIYEEEMSTWPTGDTIILDRLTICLKKVGRLDEVNTEINEYLEEFPNDIKLQRFKRILKRAKMV